MKKFLALILTAMLSLVLVACGGDNTSSTKTSSKNNSSSSQDKGNSDSTPAGNDSDSGNDDAGGDSADDTPAMEWPNDPRTDILPKPEGTIRQVGEMGGSMNVALDWTTDNAQAYGESLAADSSFSVTENGMRDDNNYYFGADKDGYHISINPGKINGGYIISVIAV
jgi:hypothetical protein